MDPVGRGFATLPPNWRRKLEEQLVMGKIGGRMAHTSKSDFPHIKLGYVFIVSLLLQRVLFCLDVVMLCSFISARRCVEGRPFGWSTLIPTVADTLQENLPPPLTATSFFLLVSMVDRVRPAFIQSVFVDVRNNTQCAPHPREGKWVDAIDRDYVVQLRFVNDLTMFCVSAVLRWGQAFNQRLRHYYGIQEPCRGMQCVWEYCNQLRISPMELMILPELDSCLCHPTCSRHPNPPPPPPSALRGGRVYPDGGPSMVCATLVLQILAHGGLFGPVDDPASLRAQLNLNEFTPKDDVYDLGRRSVD
ncbi:hypothetical protein PAPYR_10636 [Paratrimastix pyriformis]|uniref:Uncharacterized protein n=1 Tax=Paratrimastix pyriformis TaxID=342808 RepID=A0ABQ8U5I8_9EUKA|nr:hypothetical protein PAPYR_10636 [Paratrimastix pyriformis]